MFKYDMLVFPLQSLVYVSEGMPRCWYPALRIGHSSFFPLKLMSIAACRCQLCQTVVRLSHAINSSAMLQRSIHKGCASARRGNEGAGDRRLQPAELQLSPSHSHCPLDAGAQRQYLYFCTSKASNSALKQPYNTLNSALKEPYNTVYITYT